MSNRNAILGQKLCHNLYEGHTLNDRTLILASESFV